MRTFKRASKATETAEESPLSPLAALTAQAQQYALEAAGTYLEWSALEDGKFIIFPIEKKQTQKKTQGQFTFTEYRVTEVFVLDHSAKVVQHLAGDISIPATGMTQEFLDESFREWHTHAMMAVHEKVKAGVNKQGKSYNSFHRFVWDSGDEKSTIGQSFIFAQKNTKT